ncbi:histidine kinase dimerization/phospho-acceptor domain-containing protein [Pyxidicoccus caerfyrddinensis]|uniref:histidine kinase dimerization/phospho-acceptor domain-containing protein n=1 Tax=Pyxidicoccus caerfyrddinensis TaxID=2709663 RepID=UPI001F0713A9|nr:histidine kinase dimerization/phospho-acceptor domain-containing protein [Pyxidicoccus caerfyrddinensis]
MRAQAELLERQRLEKLAEMEARRTLEQLAHVSRVSALGELAASLAHELNQPLAAILSNAQAARRLLNATPAELDEVREALGDISSDSKRAGEVIHRMRALLKRGEPRQELHSLVEAHGGRLQAESPSGQGALLRCVLPAAHTESPP